MTEVERLKVQGYDLLQQVGQAQVYIKERQAALNQIAERLKVAAAKEAEAKAAEVQEAETQEAKTRKPPEMEVADGIR